MSDLVDNPEDRFSQNEAQMASVSVLVNKNLLHTFYTLTENRKYSILANLACKNAIMKLNKILLFFMSTSTLPPVIAVLVIY